MNISFINHSNKKFSYKRTDNIFYMCSQFRKDVYLWEDTFYKDGTKAGKDIRNANTEDITIDEYSYSKEEFRKIDFYFRCDLYWVYIHNEYPEQDPMKIFGELFRKEFLTDFNEDFFGRKKNIISHNIAKNKSKSNVYNHVPVELFVEDGLSSKYRVLAFSEIPDLLSHKNISNTNIEKLFPELFENKNTFQKNNKLIKNINSKIDNYDAN